MLTGKWILYSDSTHFSDKNSYKIHFIPSYGLKDMNFARLKHLQDFFQKTAKMVGLFSPRKIPARVADRRGRAADIAR
jgi:hypothetical protein